MMKTLHIMLNGYIGVAPTQAGVVIAVFLKHETRLFLAYDEVERKV
jgi:hypothetical protein